MFFIVLDFRLILGRKAVERQFSPKPSKGYKITPCRHSSARGFLMCEGAEEKRKNRTFAPISRVLWIRHSDIGPIAQSVRAPDS